ncbi:cortical cell-delineating protein-like [Triticum aestivum]|uniref:cortical cell-delineating protein-like n=1 Tax=Triticum aestivum TaxID=4565 RepID=UPI001D03466E|nr:cortical cell-delineating protein-like [Triticum aestivum]
MYIACTGERLLLLKVEYRENRTATRDRISPSRFDPYHYGSCPRDMLKVKACVNVLGLLKVNVNQPRDEHCCSLLDGLAGLDAALCL